MSFLSRLFSSPVASSQRLVSISHTNADATMRRLNPRAVHCWENDRAVFIEDIIDPDGRIYRVEYQTDAQGHVATAYCRYNPWGGNPYPATRSHLFDSGQICLGSEEPYSLEAAILRTRYWCTAYSYFREHGSFPNP